MNIKQHIEAGHYPKDDKGRALVPAEGGNIMTIYATDHGSSWPICGRHRDCADAETWAEDGQNLDGNGDLLPPAPRKVEVRRWVEIELAPEGFTSSAWQSDRPNGGVKPRPGCAVVELTGSYEMPWEVEQ